MNTTSRKSLTFKIASGFGVIILLAMALGMAGIVTLQRTTAELNNIAQNELPAAVALGTVAKNLENIRGSLRTLAIPGLDPETRARQYDNISKAREAYQAAEARFEQSAFTPEIEAAWKAYKQAHSDQKTANNQFLDACRQIDQLGIADPVEVIGQLRRFQGDHYRLELNVLALINEGVAFEGGDDHTACNFGKWLPTFKTDNAELSRLIEEMKEPHRQFHQTVADIRQAIQAGDRDRAREVYEAKMKAARTAVFNRFDELLAVAEKSRELFDQNQVLAMGELTDKVRATLDAINKVVEANNAYLDDYTGSVTRLARTTMFVLIGCILAVLVLGIVLTYSLTRSILRPVRRVVEVLGNVAHRPPPPRLNWPGPAKACLPPPLSRPPFPRRPPVPSPKSPPRTMKWPGSASPPPN